MTNKRQKRRADIVHNSNQEALIYMVFALGGLFVLLLCHGKSEYDIDKIPIKKAMERQDQVEHLDKTPINQTQAVSAKR